MLYYTYIYGLKPTLNEWAFDDLNEKLFNFFFNMSELNDYVDYDKVYELNIGKSFQNGAKVSHHQFKCEPFHKQMCNI